MWHNVDEKDQKTLEILQEIPFLRRKIYKGIPHLSERL